MITVTVGGLFFEYYLNGFASNHVFREYRSMLRKQKEDGDESLTDTQTMVLMDSCIGKFTGWLLNSCAGISRNGVGQQFYTSFILKYFGCSRGGLKFAHRLGYAPSITYIDKTTASIYDQTKEDLRYHKLTLITIH